MFTIEEFIITVYCEVGESLNVLIRDKGYLNTLLKQDLAQIDIELETPLRKTMKDDRPQSQIRFGQKYGV